MSFSDRSLATKPQDSIWLEGLENFGATVANFPSFNFMRDTISSQYYATPDPKDVISRGIHSEPHWLKYPFDHWETRMSSLPQSKYIIWFPKILECYKPNERHLEQLKRRVSSAPNNSKIVAIMCESWNTYGSLQEEGHAFCAVWHRHSEGDGADIILHDVFSEIRIPLLQFFWKHFKKEAGYNLIMSENKRKFVYEHCKDKCSDGTRLDKDSCVFMTHLAAELELRNIMPRDQKITVNMQKGYAAFLQPYSDRLRDVAHLCMNRIKERMQRLALYNKPKKKIRFCILNKWYVVNEHFRSTKLPNSSDIIPLLMNYNYRFIKGTETEEELSSDLDMLVYQIKISKDISGFGYVA